MVHEHQEEDLSRFLEKFPSLSTWSREDIQTAKFHMIYRERGRKSILLPQEELSVFIRSPSVSGKWFYAHSIVAVIDKTLGESIIARLPKYESQKTIAKRWD